MSRNAVRRAGMWALGVMGATLTFVLLSAAQGDKSRTANTAERDKAAFDAELYESISARLVADETDLIETGTGVWHDHGTASCGFIGRAYIQPDDVSFENIDVKEGAVAGVGTGYFAGDNGQMHDESVDWFGVGSVTTGKGSKLDVTDTIWTGPHTATPYSDGTFSWPIPWLFKVGTGSGQPFATVNHQETIDSTGKTTISKGGTTKSAELNDPDSIY